MPSLAMPGAGGARGPLARNAWRSRIATRRRLDRDQSQPSQPAYAGGDASQEPQMPADLQITFRGMEISPSAEAQVRKRAEELGQYSDRVTSCRVILEAAHRHHRHGNIYQVRIDLTLPGGKVVVAREPAEDHAHEDLHVAIRDA